MSDKPTSAETITFDRTTPLVPSVHDEIPSRLDPFSRDEVALLIDGYLRRLVALKNRLDPGIAAGLARMRDGERHLLLGFVTLKDYAAEVLGIDWRRARYLLSIHDAFQGLPLLAEAFECGRLSWTRAREIARVADEATEEQWLDYALGVTVRRLTQAVRRVRAGGPPPWEEGGQAAADDDRCGEAGDSRSESGALGVCSGTSPDDAERGDDQRGGWATVSIPVSPSLRRRWEEAVEACRRHAGAEAPLWECAEYMAAETLDTLSPLPGELAGEAEAGRDGTVPGEGGWSHPGAGDVSPGSAGSGRHTFSGAGPGGQADSDRWACHGAAPGEPCAGDEGDHGLSLPMGSRLGVRYAIGGREDGGPPTGEAEGDGLVAGGTATAGTAGDDRDRLIEGIEKGTGNWDFLDWAPVAVALVGRLEADLATVRGEAAGASGRDGARRLHRALLRLAGDHERIERYLGRLLRFFGDHRLPRLCQFLGLRHYARERLGLGARQVGYLTARERVFLHVPQLEQAFLDGRLGSAKVRLLEPFLRRLCSCDWQAWVEHAEGVSVRRLVDEARWALEYSERDPSGWRVRGGVPPAPGEGPYAIIDGARHTCSGVVPGAEPDSLSDEVRHTCAGVVPGAAPGEGDISSPDVGGAGVSPVDSDRHTCSGPGGEPLSSLVRFTAPPEVFAVWSRAMGACRRLLARSPHGPSAAMPREDRALGPDPPAWRCLEMIVDHFLLIWAPGRDPDHRTGGYPRAIFERDGWRCTVPGCRARSNLTPHHIVKRSRGGGDEPANLTTVCWKHHLQGIHRGRLSVSGRAPDRLYWELGCRPGHAPVLVARGDRVTKFFDPDAPVPSTVVPCRAAPRAPVPSSRASLTPDAKRIPHQPLSPLLPPAMPSPTGSNTVPPQRAAGSVPP